MMKLSIVIPVFNEDAVITTTHGRVTALLEALCAKGGIGDYEILYVDDGSRDKTLDILKELSRNTERVKVISFSRNFGHQPALAAGLLKSSGDAVVSLDADLQDPPEVIEYMIEKYLKGNDIVYGVRRSRQHDTLFKRWSAQFFYRLMNAMGVQIIYDHADYRLISRKVVESFRNFREFNIFLRGIFPYMGFRHDIVYYERPERMAGTTKYPFRKMLAFAWEGITSFSKVPLRIASAAGFAIFVASLSLVIWAFYIKISGGAIPGWTSTVIPMFFIGGLNMLFLGLIGEYMGKIYLEVKGRPLFIVKEQYNIDSEKGA